MMDAYEMGRSDGYGWDLGGFGSRDEVRAWLGWARHTISEAGADRLAEQWGVIPYGDGWYTAIGRYNRGAVEGALEQWAEERAYLDAEGVL
jgi:hypothetical protein